MTKSGIKTAETTICSYIGIVDDLFSNTSTSARLDKFKKTLYFCSSNLSHPMFLSIAQDNLLISNELLNIHELMYKFMCTSEYKCLKFNAMENINSRYESTSFTWKISDDLFPFLIAYILTTNSKNITFPSLFFEKLDNYFYKALEKLSNELTYNKEMISELYSEWTENFFGRKYFCTLDSLYKTFTTTEDQKNSLRNSINGLTRILVECPVYPNKIVFYVNKLLDHYKMSLIEKAHTPTPNPEELLPFYKHLTPWKIRNEPSFISYLNNKLIKTTQNLCHYIENHLATEGKLSKYKIAVNHFDKFSTESSKYIFDIDKQLKNMNEEFSVFFTSVKNYPSISNGIQTGILTYSQENEEKHVDEIIKLFKKYYGKIKKAFEKFVRTVKKASGEHPENYTSLTIDRDYYSELTDTINSFQNRLTQKLEDILNGLPFILYYHNPGYMYDFKYPTEFFGEDDILRITYELTGEYHNLPEDHLIQLFKSKEFVLPACRADIISFLLNFDQIIAGL